MHNPGVIRLRAEELTDKGAIYIERIQRGMSQYRWESVHLSEAQAYGRLKAEWERCGKDSCFVDFYYFYLEEESKRIVRENLTEDEKKYLDAMPVTGDEEDVIFPADDMLLRIAVKLNAREVLFSTIYFIGEPSTWWGNYKEEYLVFRK